MTRMFKKARLEVQQEASKSNMLNKFGGKFKKAFSKKNKSPVQMSNETYLQDFQPETTALLNSFAKRIEQPSTENRPDNAPTNVGVDEESDKPSQELAATASRSPAVPYLRPVSQDAQQEAPLQDPVGCVTSTLQESTSSSSSGSSTPTSIDELNTDRNTLHRSSSVPSSSSSPTTGAWSDTLYNTPRHSEISSSPPLIKFRHSVDEHKALSEKCNRALAEHLKDEQKEKENTDWAALVKWIQIGHQAEVTNLKKDNAAKVDQLRQERSEVRRRLELRSRELKAMKRDMKDLKESIETKAKDQEEIRPAPGLESLDNCDAESVDQHEGGIALATNSVTPTKEAETSRGTTSAAPQDANFGRNYTKEKKEEIKKPKNETAKDKRERQRVLKQQLLEESVPDFPESQAGVQTVQPAAIGELTSSTTQQATIRVNGDKKVLLLDIKELQDHNKALKTNLAFTREMIGQLSSEADSAEAEITKLRAENHFAQLEVGHCNAANACYRAAAEDDNPARTAHLDGLLKRKDEAYAELEKRAAECADHLAEEKKRRAVETEYAKAKIQGLTNELAYRFNLIDALAKARDILKEQHDEVFHMFEGKIFQDDIVKAFLSDYHAIQKENSLLINMINERRFYVHDAEQEVARLKAEKIVNDHAADADKLKYRRTQQNLNGLMYINHQLNAKVEIREEMREELREELEAQLKQQADDIQRLIQYGADDWLTRRHHAQEAQIAFLNREITSLNGLANHWRMRAVEQQDGFCPMNNFAEVADWNAEETRWRLRDAERQVEILQRVVRQLIGEGKDAKVLELGHDGSKWLVDRASAAKVMEEFRSFGDAGLEQ